MPDKALVIQTPNFLNLFWRNIMHSWLPSGLTERVISARRIFALVAIIALAALALPAIAQQAQPAVTPPQQPGSVVDPQPGAMTQQQVANPPAPAPSHEAGGEA